ncbi:hypothetical protein [Brevundimonas sp.]|uniref:hypothetical protein n=1 Tax=Brevundimonas sp. TaxID=1871086 RepID=UPI002D70FFBD|nr:hypothetical protein [Brevundimonas sp.]HYC68377.1 hypothetical protein [Brevundimonas sp.]
MSKIYSGSSFRPDVREVLCGREGGVGWKLDVVGHDPNWSDPYGDAWEESLDEILPHLARFVDSSSTWKVYPSGEPATFWGVISGHVIPAGG